MVENISKENLRLSFTPSGRHFRSFNQMFDEDLDTTNKNPRYTLEHRTNSIHDANQTKMLGSELGSDDYACARLSI
jgi:hypothetical protein